MASVPRLYVEQPLGKGQLVPLSRDHAHYLFGVMRRNIGDPVELFNGTDGEWTCDVVEAGKRAGVLRCDRQTKPQLNPPDLWLCFAPIKKARTDFIVEKAAEMGAARIIPMTTDYTNSDRLRQDRLQAHAVEAAEQCGGTFVPPVDDIAKFGNLLDSWPQDRAILFCDEALVGQTIASPLTGGPWAIFIGPEGGFSPAERARLLAAPKVSPTSLGPRILRADTAVVAAMTLWQSKFGDWT
ncbi:MAG: 16S rRNA (uracil(1498)-N(3))-methyltransferase [Pseudomonadota bacterium]